MTGRLYQLVDAGELDLAVSKRRLGDARGTRLFSGRLEWLAKEGTVVDTSQPLSLILVAEPRLLRRAAASD